MAITVVTKKDILEALDVPTSISTQFKSLGGKIDSGVNKIVISLPPLTPVAVKVPIGALSLIYNNMLAPHSKEDLKGKIVSSIKDALTKHKVFSSIESDPTEDFQENPFMSKVKAVLDEVPPNENAQQYQELESFKSYCEPTECSDYEMKNLEPVKLITAKRMYQPVMGTTKGSKYFLIARSALTKIAARYKDGSISIRAEGNIQSNKKTYITHGFTVSSDYASVHIVCSEIYQAKRIVGAILLGLGFAFTTPLPDISKIKGEGH